MEIEIKSDPSLIRGIAGYLGEIKEWAMTAEVLIVEEGRFHLLTSMVRDDTTRSASERSELQMKLFRRGERRKF